MAEGEKGKTGGRAKRVAKGALVSLGAMITAILCVEFATVRFNPMGILYFSESHSYLMQAIELLPEADRVDGRIFENKRSHHLALSDFEFDTDSFGMRASAPDVLFDSEKDPDRLRVLFLGDSVTLGWGVPFEDTWIQVLEKRARDKDGREVEALNAGHLQYNTIQESDWLEAHGAELRPDVIVVTFVVNDLDDAYGLYQGLKQAIADAPTLEELTFWDKLTGYYNEHFIGIRGLLSYREERTQAKTAAELKVISVEDHEGYQEAWFRASLALDRIQRLSVELGAKLIILDSSVPRIPSVKPWCEAAGVPWYDLTFTDEEFGQDIRNSLADAHANALGNSYLADKAEAALVAEGVFTAREKP
jgi:lysophospholipase L1-like esterase